MNTSKKLSIIIVTYNRYKDLQDCVASVYRMNHRPFETIVVDSYSTDSTLKIKDLYPIRFVSIKEKSMIKARNVGCSLAKGDILAFLDDDVIVDKHWSSHLLETYREDQIGGVGGRVIPFNAPMNYCQRIKTSDVGRVFSTGFVAGNFDLPLISSVEVDSFIGCNMSFRKKVVDKVGKFDENFQGNCFRDDTDFCLRVKQRGYKLLYQPRALVWHKYKGKRKNPKWVYWYTRNQTYFYFKNIFNSSRIKLAMFFYKMFFPPRDYVLKSSIDVSIRPRVIPLALKGILDGFSIYRTNKPAH